MCTDLVFFLGFIATDIEFQTNGDIYSMDFCGNLLTAGGKNGFVGIYGLDKLLYVPSRPFPKREGKRDLGPSLL